MHYMVLRILLFPVLCLGCLLSPLNVLGQSAEPKPLITPHVDERVELLSIVFRLAGNEEYNRNTLPAYSADIDRAFAQHRNHAAVQMARTLAEKNEFGYDAAMSLALSISSSPEMKPLVPFARSNIDPRWGNVADAEKFLTLLRDFYVDSKFAEFYAAHAPLYRLAEQRFQTTLKSLDLGWYMRFYGKQPDFTYSVILGMNNGDHNYGHRTVHPDGRVELFSIIGSGTHDDAGNPEYPAKGDYLPLMVHEFNHSFVNPATAQHQKELGAAKSVYAAVADEMRSMAYADAETMVNESLVRAAAIIYLQQAGESKLENLSRIRKEQGNGFIWMDQLVDLLKQYETQRTQYPTFESFLPRIASLYRELAAHTADGLAAFTPQWAHVVKVETFANGAQDVSPAIKAINIQVDKPLDPNGYSIYNVSDGGLNPITGKPEFSADGLHLLLPVKLEPNQSYGFELTSESFSTPDGHPLLNYKVHFKTK